MTKGRYIPERQRSAVYASMMLPPEERDELRRRKACAEEVLSRFDLHHIVYFSWSGSNRWHNLEPMLKADHRRRTQTDIALIGKSKRIVRKQELHGEALQAKAGLGSARRGMAMPGSARQSKARKIPSRPFPKVARKLRNKK